MKRKFIFCMLSFFYYSLNICQAQDIVKNYISKPNTNPHQLTTPPEECKYQLNIEEAQKMIKYYDALFDADRLTKEFCLPPCLFSAINTFLIQHQNEYDGVRFFIVAKRKFLGKLKSKLLIVPTKPANPITPTNKHQNIWGNVITLTNCVLPDDVYMNIEASTASKWIDDFGEEFRGETTRGDRESAKKGPLSLGIWMKSCKVKKINEFLNAHSQEFDGIVAKAGAYYSSDEMYEHGEREYETQSTLIFIPTKNCTINWQSVKDTKDFIETKRPKDVFNHGELCPQICN